MSTEIVKRAKRLEDAFFAENDRILIEKLHALQKMEESVESLSEVSGIKNKSVLKKLVQLHIRPETIAALSMVPIVEVAWADGVLDDKEKAAIISLSGKHIESTQQIARDLLNEWLTLKPPREMLEAWIHYVRGLCESLTEEEKSSLKNSFMEQVYQIAKTSGGFLGLGNKISPEEAIMLKVLEDAFK